MSPEEREQARNTLTALQPEILRLSCYLCRDLASAEDLAQASILSALQHLESWQGRGSLKSWVVQIVMNQHRRESRNRESLAEEATWEQLANSAGWSCDQSLERSERLEQVQKALLQLAESDREILLLRDVEGLSGDNTAKILGLTMAGMKSRLHRARLRLLAEVRHVTNVEIHLMSEEIMSCMEVVQCLADYADCCLQPAAVAAIDLHLKSCDRCRRFSRRYAKLLDQLHGI